MDPDQLRVAARMHDIGMAGVTKSVFTKAGPLTRDERRELQEHPELGYAMLCGSGVELLELAAYIAWTHHERWDGGGYPRALAGDAIPLAGRIVAVADTWDALTTPRVYRATGTNEDAIATLKAERGKQLDPEVVDTLLGSLEEAFAIRDRFPVPESEPSDPAPEDAHLTLQAAAATLAISPSRLRRWADEGRIPAIRTAGGHRRFPLEAVRQLAAERGVRPHVRPVDPPTTSLPLLGHYVRQHGRQMAAAAAAAVYHEGPPGWFASESAASDVSEWLEQIAAGCASGVYSGAVQASESLMRRAQQHAASLLERHAFLER